MQNLEAKFVRMIVWTTRTKRNSINRILEDACLKIKGCNQVLLMFVLHSETRIIFSESGCGCMTFLFNFIRANLSNSVTTYFLLRMATTTFLTNVSGQSFWLHPEVRIRFSSLPDVLRSSGTGTGSTQLREYN
jgi:hypothetical protein